MPIEKIKFEKLFPTVQYGNELFVMEGTLAPGEHIAELYDEMHYLAVRQFERNNPNMAGQSTLFQPPEPTILPVTPVEKVVEDFKEISIIEQIQSCKSASVLKIYKPLLKTEKDEEAYDEKMIELMSPWS